MKRKITSLILAVAMLLSMMPAASLSVFAEDGHTITVNTSAKTAFETKQGKQETIPLAGYFTDSEGHELTYTLSGKGLRTQTKIVEKDEAWYLSFTEPNEKVYTITVTATCSEDQSVSASVNFTVDVKKGDAGLSAQYDYDETNAKSVKVYVTVSNDGMPLMGIDGTVLSHLEVEVPYFDLANQDMGQLYRYHTENGSGPYVNDTLVERPTALHLYLYLLGKYYLGLEDSGITGGETKIQEENGSGDVYYMDGKTAAYDASNKPALSIEGSATSMYMKQFWGHDENLMYYRNHVYPYMSPGWGATADYVLLSDGDTIDIAMYSDWSFWSDGGAFACFDKDSYTVEPNGTLTFKTLKFGTRSVADGGTDDFEPITGLDVAVYTVNKDGEWIKVAGIPAVETGKNEYSYTFDNAGTYYLMALDPKAASKNARVAPATAKVVVKEAPVTHNVTFSFPDYFEGKATVADGEDYTFKLAEPYFSDRANYTLSLSGIGTMAPSDSANKDAIDNGDGTYTIKNVTGDLKITSKPKGRELGLTVTANKGEMDMACNLPTETPQYKTEYSFNLQNIDSNSIYRVTVKVAGNAVPVEVQDWSFADLMNYTVAAEYMTGDVEIYVEELDKSAIISVTGVTLDQSALSLIVGGDATLTATVAPENATNKTVTWTTSNDKVATVADGKVTAVGAGEATITVTTADGSFTATCTVTVAAVEPAVPTQDADGTYLIRTGKQLKWFADQVNGGNTKINGRLERDVDLSGICSETLGSWTPIGNAAANKYYSGTFDGQNHKITGLYINNVSTGNYIALFGDCHGATIQNLSVYGEVSGQTSYMAGIVGRLAGSDTGTQGSLLENCHNFVKVTGKEKEGTRANLFGYAGVAGSATNAVIRGCSNQAEIQGVQGGIGGILGITHRNDEANVTVESCWNTGKIAMTSFMATVPGVGGIVGSTGEKGTLNVRNCYNTGAVAVDCSCSSTHSAGVGGIVGYGRKGTLSIEGCYNTGSISNAHLSNFGIANGIFAKNSSAKLTVTDSYYLTSSALADKKTNGTPCDTAAELSEKLLAAAGDAYIDSCPTPVLKGQTAVAHSAPDADGKCTVCGKVLVETPVPTRKEGYPAETTATVQTGKAYLLSDLQTGKVFDPVEGEKLTYQNYYYQRSTDGGKTWGAMTGFAEATFGGTIIQLTETAEGTYTYRFFASHDGKNFSKDTWTLTLTVMDNPPMDFSFFVGKDYTGEYPVIKLYSVTTDGEGNETLGTELTGVTKGEVENNYQMFYANLIAGRYAYRAFAKNAETGEYDIALGGMTLDLPTDTNVDGGAGGGNNIYLQCNSFYVTSKKTDNTYFAAGDYHVEVVCPLMGNTCVMGTPYVKDNYTYYPTVLYAAGNACLYNLYAYPDIDGYIFTQTINQTFRAGSSAATKSLTINTAVTLTVTVPADADFGLYFQWNNFNTTEVEPTSQWKDNGDGTKTAEYAVAVRNSNYTWRLSGTGHVTRAGWINGNPLNADKSIKLDLSSATDRESHDFSKLGTQTVNRDEADLQVNLDPTGYKAITGTTRVRAYRHWQLINSDAGNIMVEPDFHWNVLSGDATFDTVNGGNAGANWADVTPGTKDSILTVYYDSVDTGTLNPFNGKVDAGSHGGLYPATQPNRLGVIVVGGTDVTHGTADAHVKYNMAPGATTTRSAEWDYNYDTWFYETSEASPALTFSVTGTGETTVEYAFVTANANMTAVKSDFTAASTENGTYTVPLAGFRALGAGKGGTVVIKMTDSTGVSYRLVRVAEVTITAENVSNPGEVIMPGDQVKLTWTGMYRAVNKVSGIFNPTTFKPTYYFGETKYEGTLGQYQKMDNASVTVTIPKDVTFAEGEDTARVAFTGGYTFGSMYAAANPFAYIYSMTDTGVGTNFNAVTVNYYMNHYADAVVTVSRKVLYDTVFRVNDETGAALDGVTVTLTGPEGAVEAGANGHFSLGYGKYSYTLSKDGYVATRGSFALSSADADKVVDGVLTISASMIKAGENAWDGTTLTEPKKDADGAYLIGTAAELAWFAKNGNKASAKLTADIELAGQSWTPMNNLYGTFDGQGHVIRNLYINSSSYPVGLFGYLRSGAHVTRLGVTGDVTCTASSNAQAGGIAGYMDGSSITQCFSAVNVSSKKYGGGIVGYADGSSSIISDCYATGNITTSSVNECYLGGICGGSWNDYNGATIKNCYFAGTVKGSGGKASYIGGISVCKVENNYKNCYYQEGVLSGESPTQGTRNFGTAKTAEELKALAPTLGGYFTADAGGINGGYPILKWQIGLSYVPVSTVTLNKTELELIVGKDETLTATVTPGDASEQSVTWTSSAPEIAKVENGKVTALAEGTATITVTTADGGKTAQCQVTVKPIPTYSVTLPADFTGESTVKDGADYTFTATDYTKYIYTVTATVDGETVTVIDNGDGTYTVKNVTGVLVIESTKVRKSEPITPVGPAKPDKPAEPEQPEKPALAGHPAFVTGYADGTVRPLNNITRSEIAAMLCRLLTDSQKQSALAAGKTFSDVPADAWYSESVSALAGMGVITGRPDGTFAPGQNITRAEFAVMLTRFAGVTGEVSGDVTFSDISGHWAESAIRAAAAQGWVKGMSDGTFRPDASITRAEAMAMLCRMLGCVPASAAELPEDMPVFTDNADTGAWYYLYVQEAACARQGK